MNVSPPAGPGPSSVMGESDEAVDYAVAPGARQSGDDGMRFAAISNPLGAREIIRLFQCRMCNKILNHPLALPCGETLCRPCLPPVYRRRNISYPDNPDRRSGFSCPFEDCNGAEHSLADCDTDITLSNIISTAEGLLAKSNHDAFPPKISLGLVPVSGEDLKGNFSASHTFYGGKLSATFQMAMQGLLPYASEVEFNTTPDTTALEIYDKQIYERLLTNLRSESDCRVCYCLYLDATTTSCGHTFCKQCLMRARDHSNLCPFCRRPLSPHRSEEATGANTRIQRLLSMFYPEPLAARQEQENQEGSVAENSIPIFACAMTFPQMPMFLHIFEPRYRLMLRRAIDNGSRCFGMVAHRQGPLQTVDDGFEAPFARHGTMLYVTSLQMFPDGRSLVETVGIYRFKILSYTWMDGYPVANIERLEDIPFAEEEAVEAMERRSADRRNGPPMALAQYSTQELLQKGLEYVNSMRDHSAGWFTDRILDSYGQPPNDPASFPFWVATLMPVSEREKYLVLISTSVRERLKFVIGWMEALEQRSW